MRTSTRPAALFAAADLVGRPGRYRRWGLVAAVAGSGTTPDAARQHAHGSIETALRGLPRGAVRSYRERMERTARSYGSWLTLVGELLQADPGNRPFPHGTVVGLLRESFDATSCMHNVVDSNWTDHLIDCWPHGFLPTQLPVERPMDATFHPLIRWYAMTGDSRPQTTARVPSGIATRRLTADWSSFARPLGITHQLCLPLQVGEGMQAYVLGRPDRDYAEADRALATALAPALSAVLRQHGILAGVASAQRSRGHDLGLTGREVAVLQLLGQGRTAASIAHRLGTSPRTVHKHLEHVYRKLGVQDRLVAVQRARELGLLAGSPGTERT